MQAKKIKNDDWMTGAACRGMDIDVFFPPYPGESKESSAHARSICAGCPVKTECLDYAMADPREIAGVWGGLTEAKRRTIRRYERRGSRGRRVAA